jgi:hypothetical protein
MTAGELLIRQPAAFGAGTRQCKAHRRNIRNDVGQGRLVRMLLNAWGSKDP